jgi:putative ABC transport system substrate-binding protein
VLSPITREAAAANITAFRRALRELGYVEGRSITVEYRFAGGLADVIASHAAELVKLGPDVIVAGSVTAIVDLHEVTKTIPLVGIAMSGDLVGLGLVASYNRPGGNVTGLSFPLLEEMIGKRVSLLKELAPGITRVGFMFSPADFDETTIERSADQLRKELHLDVRLYPLREPADFEVAFAAAERDGVDGLCVIESVLLNANRERIVALVNRLRRPAIYGFREFVVAGGLICYSISLPEQYRRAAAYADKILKGARPGDLPINEANEFDLAINLGAAKALGLTVPSSLLAQATEVIE